MQINAAAALLDLTWGHGKVRSVKQANRWLTSEATLDNTNKQTTPSFHQDCFIFQQTKTISNCRHAEITYDSAHSSFKAHLLLSVGCLNICALQSAIESTWPTAVLQGEMSHGFIMHYLSICCEESLQLSGLKDPPAAFSANEEHCRQETEAD